MINNHLVIGLGGTGGKVLRSLRKTVYHAFRSEGPVNVNVRYLYVDSSDEMMAPDDPTWKVLGQNVQLSKASQLEISSVNLASVLDNPESYPGISPWIGSREAFRGIFNSTGVASITGGQKRRLGRLLFACCVAQFREQVQALVREMESGSTAPVTFHVCCGLAGVTGSGCIVDAVSQIRTLYPGKDYRIIIYAFLPDRNPGANRAGANYHANGYAALVELNALSIGVFRPHDLSGEKKDRLELQDPFNCCYLFAEENEDHNKIDVDKEIPDLVSAFLYQKIVAVKDMVWDSLRQQETFENMDFRPEESPFSHHPERSRQFFTFGIKQIVYPEQEIQEYLTYTFARQAVLQLQFNHWTESRGYSDGPGNRSFSEFVHLKETHQKWHLSDEHLYLSEGILPDEIKNKRWKPVNTFWLNLVLNLESHIRESFADNDRVWLEELSKLCETAYSQNYRDVGVHNFYETKRGEIKEHVCELRGRIEKDLFHDWMTGQRSMHDISRLLAALLASLEERQQQMESRLAKHRQMEEEAAARVTSNATEWLRLGVISGRAKRQNLLNAQVESLQQLYIYRTRIEGLDFAMKLLQSLIADLAILASEVDRCVAMMVEVTKDFTGRIAERCADLGQADLQKPLIRFYNPETVKNFAKALVCDRTEQQKQTTTVRAALARLLGEDQNFSNLNLRIPKEKFIEVLESISLKNVTAAHNNYVAAHSDRARILQLNVLERLQREYTENPEALRAYLGSVVSRAKNHLCFNETEVTRQGPGTFQASEFVSYLSMILPEAPGLTDFLEWLRKEFQNAAPGAKDQVTSKGKSREITLVNITNLFPLRFVQQVGFLREKYEQRIKSSDSAQARMELHLEADGSTLPNLYVGDVELKKFLAYLMIGKAMEVVQTLEDPETGLKNLYLVNKNEMGRENQPVPLGRDLNDAIGESNQLTFNALVATIQPLLKKEYLHIQKREALSASVQAQIDEIKAKRKNPMDKVYRMFYNAGEAAVVLLGTRQ